MFGCPPMMPSEIAVSSRDDKPVCIDDSLVEELKRKRKSVMPLTDDAEYKRFTEQETRVKEWLVDLNHTLYDADALLDQLDTEKKMTEVRGSSSSYSDREIKAINSRIIEINNKLAEITKKLEDADEDGKRLGLKCVDGKRPAAAENGTTTPSLRAPAGFYGRNEEKKQILEWLLSAPDSASPSEDVLAIVGMGGLGKTTLAQYVYHHADVARDFARSWACVSSDCDLDAMIRMTRTILETLTGSPSSGFGTLPGLQNELKRQLGATGKRFLIVLDDVGRVFTKKWQMLITPFSSRAQGSKILVTTRDHSVASKVSLCRRCELKPMSEEEGWSLFSKHVFGEDDSSQYSELETIGKDIVIKCGGLPLAIKTLGGVLRSERDEKEWRRIRESCIWQLSESDGRNNIVPALSLSYSCLPSHLKTCFAYCALFPKAYEFSVDELVNLWIDEGFVQQPNDGKSIEDVARGYFKELMHNISFFARPYGNIDVYVMHDVMHDLAQLLYADFHLQLDGHTTGRDCKKVRNVSYHSRESNANDTGLRQIEALQTFVAHKIYPRWNLKENMLLKLVKQPFLRVLCLRGSTISRLPEALGDLKLLRRLDVSYTDVVELPISLCKLHSLRRLLCDGCDCLKEFYIDMSGLNSLRRYTLSGKHLRRAPRNLRKLGECSVRLVFCLPLQPADVDMAQAEASDTGHTRGAR